MTGAMNDARAIQYIEKYTAPVICAEGGKVVGFDLDAESYEYLLYMAKRAVRLHEALEYISRNEGRILAGSVAREALREVSH